MQQPLTNKQNRMHPVNQRLADDLNDKYFLSHNLSKLNLFNFLLALLLKNCYSVLVNRQIEQHLLKIEEKSHLQFYQVDKNPCNRLIFTLCNILYKPLERSAGS